MPGYALRDALDLVRILCLHADSRPDSLAEVRRQVRQAVAETPLPPEAVEDLELAAGELLSNVWRHAYPSRVGPVFVEVFRTRRRVTLVIIDRGAARATPVIPAEPPRHARPGGRGIYLANCVADEMRFSINPIGHGLAVRVSKWVLPGNHLRRSA